MTQTHRRGAKNTAPIQGPLLIAGVLGPLVYVALVAAATLLFPGYSHATQFISELGASGAPHPAVFNYGLMLAGGLTILGAAGLSGRLLKLGGGWVPSALAGLTLAMFGASIVLGGVFPLPDERHMAWGTGFAVQVAPLFVLVALRNASGLRWLKALLIATFVAINMNLAVMFGVGDLVSQDNIGLWQRVYAFAMYPWIAIAALTLLAVTPEQST
jgi:hypothetical membrane protein